MGWWQIASKDEPGIMLPNNDPYPLVCGDGPADIMGAGLDKIVDDIVKEYKEYRGRKPYMEEIYAVFEFCVGTSTGRHDLRWRGETNDANTVSDS